MKKMKPIAVKLVDGSIYLRSPKTHPRCRIPSNPDIYYIELPLPDNRENVTVPLMDRGEIE